MKTSDVVVLGGLAYLALGGMKQTKQPVLLPQYVVSSFEGLGNAFKFAGDTSQWINNTLDSMYPVSSYIPQVGLSNIFGKVTYTPALVGPLSSTDPNEWKSWLI